MIKESMSDRATNCNIYRQLALIVSFLVSSLCCAADKAKCGRAPANFVPDDDIIVVPMIIERNFIEDFHHKHGKEFKSARKKLQHWISQEQYAQDYGLERSGIVTLPTKVQKENFLHRHYLRFISKDLERTSNKSIQNTVEEWTADDEIDSITAVEQHEKVIIKARKSKGKSELKHTQSVKVGKSKMKVGFQLRPEIGMAKFTVKSKHFSARAWVGVNGNQELKVDRKFKSTGTTTFINYYIDETRLLAAVDQNLVKHWTMRLTHTKDIETFENLTKVGVSENNILQLRFNMGF
jgi:hypothetical protein